MCGIIITEREVIKIKGDNKMIRTTKQLQNALKEGYTIKKFGYKVTGTETCICDPIGRKVAWKITTVTKLAQDAEKLGLLK